MSEQYADLRRLAEQMIADGHAFVSLSEAIRWQAILALLDRLTWAESAVASSHADLDAAERRVAALEEGLRALLADGTEPPEHRCDENNDACLPIERGGR